MCGFALKLLCYYDENYSLPVYVDKGKDTSYHLIEQVLEYEHDCEYIRKSHL